MAASVISAPPLAAVLPFPRNPSPSLPRNPSPFPSPFFRSSRRRRFPIVAFQPQGSLLWRISASTDDVLAPEAAVEKAQQVAIPAATNDGVGSTVVASLLAIAFVGLTVLTIGVIYISVTEFLDKREREKFEKEEAANKKKDKKNAKVKVKARSGPRGFGQKIEEDVDD